MFSAPEQFSAVTQASVEARLAIINAVTSKAFEGLEKVIDLNLNTVRASLAESAAAARQLFSIESPQDFLTLATQAQPNLEKLLTYGRQLADISARTQAELLQVASKQLAESGQALPQPPAKPSAAAVQSASIVRPKAASPAAKPSAKAAKLATAPTPKKTAVKAKATPDSSKPTEPASPAKQAVAAAAKPAAASAAAKPAAAAHAAPKVAAEKSATKPAVAASPTQPLPPVAAAAGNDTPKKK